MRFWNPAAYGCEKGLILRFLAAVLFLLAAASLHAGGTKDIVLARADELIENKEYDQAIQALTEYVKDNPDKFSDAQKRLQKIVRLREQYNTIADELLDTLVNDPDNNEKILSLSVQLTTIELASNPATRHFLEQVRTLAVFNSNRNRLEEILEQGRGLLAQGDYRGALNVYASGLDIYQEEFFASGFGEEAEAVVIKGFEDITQAVTDFSALTEPFAQAIQGVQNHGGDPLPEEVRRLYSALIPRLEEFSLIRNSLFETGAAYENQLAILQGQDDSLRDRSFLSFASRLISGPAGQDEGMIGALDRYWHDYAVPAEAALAALAENSYNRAQSASAARNYAGAVPFLESAGEYLELCLNFVNHWLVVYQPSEAPVRMIFDEPVMVSKAGDYLRYQSMLRAVEFIREAGDVGVREQELTGKGFPALLSWRQGTMTAEAAAAEDQANRRAFEAMAARMDVLNGEIAAGIEAVWSYLENSDPENPGDPAAGSTLPLLYMNQAQDIASALDSVIRDQEYQAMVRRYTISTEDLSGEVNAREEEFVQGSRLVEGIPGESGGNTARYPTEGLAFLTQMNQQAAVNLAAGRTLLDLYSAEPPEITGSGEVGGLYSSAVSLVDRLVNLQNRTAAVSSAARTQIARADAFRLEGDRLFQESQAALGQDNFDVARERLQRATDRYHESLAIQESASLRSTWDTRVVTLGQEIVRIENEIVVRDVRNMVTNARNFYYAGNMEQAESLLVRAQNRWRDTNITEQPEVEYWLNLVRGALSLQSGRTIPATAPLYAEMSQFLSDAKMNYDEGVRLLNAGQRRQGLAKFDEARQLTRKVRLMFPRNHDARMLELRIDQQTDASAFNDSFRQRLNEAVAGTKPSVRSVESFADLQDLAEINPRYPGIQALLSQAEIDMGYRPPPPDPRDLARSAELVRAAQIFVSARDSTQYEVARTQLEEAIRLNPNNVQAQALIDQVQTLMTGTGAIVLSSRAQDLYTQAVQLYQQGNYLSANAIVQQLLQDPENRKSTLILELQRRIQSVL
jgi:hypothetical protein